ncbi:MAG: hypothetical protein ACK4XY_11085 [Chloroherpetonaceae bacterium]
MSRLFDSNLYCTCRLAQTAIHNLIDNAIKYSPFQKLSSIPTGKERSAGLGLALCKQLVELHRESIRIESAGKNQGATIVVELLSADDSDLRTS